MPPRVRRPAAAPQHPRRRPAAQGPPRPGGPVWLAAQDVKLEELEVGKSLVVKGDYWEGDVDLCGILQGVQIEGSRRTLKLRGPGTRSEALLKYLRLSRSRNRELEVHLCPDPCDSRIWRDDLIHARRLCKVIGEREAWMSNLGELTPPEEAEEDANKELRR